MLAQGPVESAGRPKSPASARERRRNARRLAPGQVRAGTDARHRRCGSGRGAPISRAPEEAESARPPGGDQDGRGRRSGGAGQRSRGPSSSQRRGQISTRGFSPGSAPRITARATIASAQPADLGLRCFRSRAPGCAAVDKDRPENNFRISRPIPPGLVPGEKGFDDYRGKFPNRLPPAQGRGGMRKLLLG